MQVKFTAPLILGLFSILCAAGCITISSPSNSVPPKLATLKELTLEKLPPDGSDSGYWFYQRNMPESGPAIFHFDDAHHIHMNINKNIVNFRVLQSESSPQIWKFQSGAITAVLKPGPKSMDGNLVKYPQATLTISAPAYKTVTIPVKGLTLNE